MLTLKRERAKEKEKEPQKRGKRKGEGDKEQSEAPIRKESEEKEKESKNEEKEKRDEYQRCSLLGCEEKLQKGSFSCHGWYVCVCGQFSCCESHEKSPLGHKAIISHLLLCSERKKYS